MNLTDLFDLSFVNRAASVALEFQGAQFTFRDLDIRSNRLARLLLDRGLRGGDPGSASTPNCIELIDLYLACVKTRHHFRAGQHPYKERRSATF
jgi:acyl-CoA synthetase (AMP-forming)/AMP-acid ligase II